MGLHVHFPKNSLSLSLSVERKVYNNLLIFHEKAKLKQNAKGNLKSRRVGTGAVSIVTDKTQ